MKEKILGIIAVIIFVFLRLTWRIKYKFLKESDRDLFFKSLKSKKPETNFIIAFYHRDETVLVPLWKYRNIGVLVSSSKDGNIMNTIATVLGYQTIRGSSSRKAVSGLLAAMKHVRAGNKFSIAIDGPKGPIYEVKDGIIAISKKTNTKIVPIVTTPKRFYTFEKAWNKARFPYPFNSIEVKVGEIKEYTREELEKMLTSLDER